MKPKIYIHVGKATHFLSWELPYFQKFFNVVDIPGQDTVLFSFGPDALASGAQLPALRRTALLFPGFGYNPYHDLVHRYGMQRIIDESYDLVFVNPGPIHEAFKDRPQIEVIPFSLNTGAIKAKAYRRDLNSLLHVSAQGYAQKDWQRSAEIMRLTGLKHEIFPPRRQGIIQRGKRRLTSELQQRGIIPKDIYLKQHGYVPHSIVIEKYHAYDGFVHIAGETPPYVDGKYTATFLEAGLTGCLLFWHDTLNLGNDFETVFDLPLDSQQAATEILSIRDSIDIYSHSKKTSEEIFEYVNPSKIMRIRFESIQGIL